MKETRLSPKTLALIPLGIGLNIVLGTIAHALKIPFYFDAIGTIAITLLIGIRAGIITGVGSFILGGALFNPVLPWFSGTQAIIAIYCYVVGKKGFFRTYSKTIMSGIGLGIVAGIVSAPVIVYLFGGITGSGASLIAAYFIATGKTLFKAVIYSGLASEPLDKTLQCLIAIWLLRGLPASLLSHFENDLLVNNNLLRK